MGYHNKNQSSEVLQGDTMSPLVLNAMTVVLPSEPEVQKFFGNLI
jgi:hypothetical protein